jgi:hypothetical protein
MCDDEGRTSLPKRLRPYPGSGKDQLCLMAPFYMNKPVIHFMEEVGNE